MSIFNYRIDNRIQFRLSKKEYLAFEKLRAKYPEYNKSTLCKALIFRDIKPFLSEQERELVEAILCEINAIGRNLNRLLKYKTFSGCQELINDIQEYANNLKKIL